MRVTPARTDPCGHLANLSAHRRADRSGPVRSARIARLLLLTASLLLWSLLRPVSASAQPANWFVDSLTEVTSGLAVLLPELQRAGPRSASWEVIPNLRQVEADTATLIARTRRGESYESVAAAYQNLDLRWRDASYRLRASGQLPSTAGVHVGRIDGVFRKIDRRLGLQPPIDRVRLRDLMIVTLTYMDAMFDDIRLSQGFSQQSEEWLVNGRVLRERLRQESYRIDGSEFDDIVASFTEFVVAWRAYAMGLHRLNDPHILRRLESIRRQGEEVFATLRIPAAMDQAELVVASRRLPTDLNQLADRVGAWGAERLTADQFRFRETCRSLAKQGEDLSAEISRSGVSSVAQSQFSQMDQTWRDGLRLMASVDPRSGVQPLLAQVNTSFRQIRDLLGGNSWRSQTELLALVASLDAHSEQFNSNLQRFQRLLEPAAYRDRLGVAAQNFQQTAKTLHRQVGETGDPQQASETTRLLVRQWNELTPLVNELSSRGLPATRTEWLLTPYRDLYPLVTQASTLLTR